MGLAGSGDVLSAGFLSPFSDGSCEYASVEHFAQCSLLSHMGLIPDSMAVLEEKTAPGAVARAQAAIRASVPPGTLTSPSRPSRPSLSLRPRPQLPPQLPVPLPGLLRPPRLPAPSRQDTRLQKSLTVGRLRLLTEGDVCRPAGEDG